LPKTAKNTENGNKSGGMTINVSDPTGGWGRGYALETFIPSFPAVLSRFFCIASMLQWFVCFHEKTFFITIMVMIRSRHLARLTGESASG
jgi:hypothetical protein